MGGGVLQTTTGRPTTRVRRLISHLLLDAVEGGHRVVVASAVRASSAEEEWKEYADRGRKRAMELGNRGPIRFDQDGHVAQDILDAYWDTGFYVFEQVMHPEEV